MPLQASPTADKPTLDAPAAGEKAPSDFMSDIAGELEVMDSGNPPAQPERKTESEPDEKSPPAGETKPPAEAKPTEGETKPPAGETKPEGKPTRMRELGERYDGLKKEIETTYKPTIARLEARVKELETIGPKDDGRTQTELKALQDRNAELERHIAFVDYSRSRDFQTKYEQPYQQAWNEAVSEFKELVVTDEGGEERAATEHDLLRLANMKLSDMDRTAQEMFGASSSRAIGHIQNLKKLSNLRHKALQDAQERASELAKEMQAGSQAQDKELIGTWQAINKSLQERFPKAFTPEEGNDDDKAGHVRGFALADLLFVGERGLTPEQIEALPKSFKDTVKAGQPLSPTQRVQLHSLIRLKAANHDRQLVKIKTLNLRIQELEKELADYQKSEPGAGRTSPGKPVGDGKDWLETAEAELQAMDRKG